jgi:CDP-diacylglycerol---serine O-phosphatidyltransferase
MIEHERQPRQRDQSINRLIPNMLTVMALCAGLTSVLYALQGRWEPAVIAIVVAGVLDGLDGRIARLLNGQSKFGAELDSLSDFVSFGVAPALLMYQWQLAPLKGVGWALTLMFAVCCALRLARFNTKLDNTDLPAWTSRFFVGVPAPAGAGLVLIPIMATFEFGPGYFFSHPYFVGAVMLVVALMMVSRLPTYSIKRVRIPHRHVMAALLVFGLLAALLVSIPWLTLLGVGVVYVGSMPVAVIAHRRLTAQQPPRTPGDIDVSRDQTAN